MKETKTAWSKGGPSFNIKPANPPASQPKPATSLNRTKSALKLNNSTSVETKLEKLQPLLKRSDPSVFDVVENAKKNTEEQQFDTFKDKILSPSPRAHHPPNEFFNDNPQGEARKNQMARNGKRTTNPQGDKKLSTFLSRGKEKEASGTGLNRFSKLNLNERDRSARPSAFGDRNEKSREEREARKKKYDEIAKEKTRYSVDELLEIRAQNNFGALTGTIVHDATDPDFEGLFKDVNEKTTLAIEEEFDSKRFVADWQEDVKKDKVEKSRRFEQRQNLPPTPQQKPINPWRKSPQMGASDDPLWSDDDPKKGNFDLADLASMTQKMNERHDRRQKDQTESFGFEDMAAMAQKFEREMKGKSSEKEVEMPSFFVNTMEADASKEDLLEGALEDDVDRPPEEVQPLETEEYTFDSPSPQEMEPPSFREEPEMYDMNIEREKRRLQEELEFTRHQPFQQNDLELKMEYMKRQQMQEAQELERRRQQEEYYRQQEIKRRQWELQQQQQWRQAPGPGPAATPGPRWIPGDWFYKDPQGQTHGPFSSKQMRTWLDRKYFNENLLITRHAPHNQYVLLKQFFPNLATSFLEKPPVQQPPGYGLPQSHFPMHQQMGMNQQPVHQNYPMPRREPERTMFDFDMGRAQPKPRDDDLFLDFDQASLNRSPRVEMIPELSPSTTAKQPESVPEMKREDLFTQRKLESTEDFFKQPEPVDVPEPNVGTLDVDPKPVAQKEAAPKQSEPKQKKGNLEGKADNLKKMLGLELGLPVKEPKQKQPKQEAPKPVQVVQNPVEEKVAPAPNVNPWSKPKTAELPSTSLRQIQQEQSEMLKQSIDNGTYQPSHPKLWANLVASNSSSNIPQHQIQPQVLKRPSGKSKDGKSPTAEMLKWCEAQCNSLRTAKKPQDLTSFFEFCLNLENSANVRDYFKDNLGSSQEVSKFATEFLNYKARIQASPSGQS